MGGMFGTSKSYVQKLSNVVMECFNTVAFGKYQIVRSHHHAGLLQLLIAGKSAQTRVKDIFSCSVTTGMYYVGYATCIRFGIDDTTLCFANVNISQGMAVETLEELM
jgi:hypothetical protein